MLIVSIIESEALAWKDQTFALANISWDDVITLAFTGKYLKNRADGAFRFQFEVSDERVIVSVSEEGHPNTLEMVMYEQNYLPIETANQSLKDLLITLGSEVVLAGKTGNMAIHVANVQVSSQKIGGKPVLLADNDIKEFVLLSKILKQIKSNLSDPKIKSQAVGKNGNKTFFYEVTRFDHPEPQILDGLEITAEPESYHVPSIRNGETIQVLWRDTPSNVNAETEKGISVLAGIKSIYEAEATPNIDSLSS